MLHFYLFIDHINYIFNYLKFYACLFLYYHIKFYINNFSCTNDLQIYKTIIVSNTSKPFSTN